MVECQAPLADFVGELSGNRPDRCLGQAVATLRLACFLDEPSAHLPNDTGNDSVQSSLSEDRSNVCRGNQGKGLQVGLVWAGNPKQQRDRIRSCRFEALLPLS